MWGQCSFFVLCLILSPAKSSRPKQVQVLETVARSSNANDAAPKSNSWVKKTTLSDKQESRNLLEVDDQMYEFVNKNIIITVLKCIGYVVFVPVSITYIIKGSQHTFGKLGWSFKHGGRGIKLSLNNKLGDLFLLFLRTKNYLQIYFCVLKEK